MVVTRAGHENGLVSDFIRGSLSNKDGDGYERKRYSKSEVALLLTLSHLFHLVQFVKCWQFYSGVQFLRGCPRKNRWGGGGGGRAGGGDLIVFVVPGVGHLTDLVLPGEGIFESFFARRGDI